ncbi:MAG TPA: TonB-dependent receptor, partial [Longimicrobium sp.]
WAGAQPGNAAAVADSQGVYRVCGAPAGVPLTVRAATAEAAVTLSGVLVSADRPRREDLALPAPRTASAPQRTGTAAGVSGVLRDAGGRPIAGATVRVGASPAVTTDAQGRFRASRVAAGTHAVAVTHPSIGSRSVEVPLPADAAELDLRAGAGATLAASVQRVVQLAAIGARAESRRPSLDIQGFYERQRAGIGRFLTGADLDRRPGARLSDALRRVSGIRVMLLNRGSSSMRTLDPVMVVASTRGMSGGMRSGNACYLSIYVDGIRKSHPANVDEILLADAEAVEVYHGSEVPAQYRSNLTTCGVVLVWSRASRPPDPKPSDGTE